MNSSRPGWWSRNWFWALPLGCAMPVLVCGGFLTAVIVGAFSVMKSAPPYKDSISLVQQDERAIEALGEPITAGYSMQGEVNLNNDSGKVDITFPVSGPKGSGTMHVVATKEGGQWTNHEISLAVNGEKIDLLGSEVE